MVLRRSLVLCVMGGREVRVLRIEACSGSRYVGSIWEGVGSVGEG